MSDIAREGTVLIIHDIDREKRTGFDYVDMVRCAQADHVYADPAGDGNGLLTFLNHHGIRAEALPTLYCAIDPRQEIRLLHKRIEQLQDRVARSVPPQVRLTPWGRRLLRKGAGK